MNKTFFFISRPGSIFVFISFFLLFFRTVPSFAVSDFALGSIPDFTVAYRDSVGFYFHWDNHPDAVFTMSVTGSPQGEIEFSRDGNSAQYAFSYLPAEEDNRPFLVTINGYDEGGSLPGGKNYSHTFRITPQAELGAEATVFTSEQHTQPVTSSENGIDVTIEDNPFIGEFNYVSYPTTSGTYTKDITIVGNLIELKEGHENGLYEAYCSKTNKDIKNLTIISEEVYFYDDCRVKGANVTIYARELRMEGSAQISTEPEENKQTPVMTEDGVDGLDAGNIDLFVQFLYINSVHIAEITGETPTYFVARGGQGQKAGPGQDGEPGVNCQYFTSAQCRRRSYYYQPYIPPAGYGITYFYCNYWIAADERVGDENCIPTDGGDATPPGIPGNGGNGGDISFLGDANSTAFSNNGGYPGRPPRETQYYGGLSGFPAKSQQVEFNELDGAIFIFETIVLRETEVVDGADAGIIRGSFGSSGELHNLLNNNYSAEYSWMHPLLIRKVVGHAKETYLAGDLSSAEIILEEYAQLLSDYIADTNIAGTGSYDQLDEDSQHDLEVLYNEMETMLHRIASNLDYFGNPAGWVPMLSFEVSQAMFDTEIDRAINMLYLSYWLGNKADTEEKRMAALTSMRDYLWAEYDESLQEYNDLVENQLPTLLAEGERLENQTASLQNELQVKENDLSNQANRLQWYHAFEFSVRLALKGAAMICKALPIPMVQPALGDIGGGLMDTVSNLDIEEPWETIIALPDVASTYANTQYNSAVGGLNRAMWGVKDYPDEKARRDYWKEARRTTSAVSTGVKDIADLVKNLGVPDSKAKEKLEELRGKDPQYQDIVDSIEQHLDEKKQYALELEDMMQRISLLANTIDEDLMAVDALSRELTDVTIIDPRARGYLKGLEQRAYDRLLKYHYYMAKAYEYRVLDNYEETINMQGLINQFEIIGSANSHEITPEEFDTLKGIYEEIIAGVAQQIYDGYIASGVVEYTFPVEFSLTQEELDKLNEGEPLTLNLWERDQNDLFFWDEENIRITDLEITEIETESEGGIYGDSARVRVRFEHSGYSNLRIDGHVYQFRHYNQNTRNAITWDGLYNPLNETIVPGSPSEASDSLLRSLLQGNAQQDMLLYSRPAAWADLNVSKTVSGNSGNDITITKLRLQLTYDYTLQDYSLGLWDITVSPCPTSEFGADLAPYYVVSQSDTNDRKNGARAFLRTYQESNRIPIAITAQEKLGNWTFHKWLNKYGDELTGGPYTDPTIELLPNQYWGLCAAYQFDVTDTTDSDGDGISDEIENSSCTSAYDADTDDDGVPDGFEDANGDGLLGNRELDPCNVDTDGDNSQDGTELGYIESMLGSDTDLSIFIADPTPYSTTNPLVNPAQLVPSIIFSILLGEEE